MMLKYLPASLTDAAEKVIAHGCNLKGHMGAGVALAIKNKWPKVFTAYQYAVTSGGLYVGAVNWAERGPGLYVANIITQQSYGKDPKIRYASYDGIDRGLRTMAREALERNYISPGDTVAISMIGSGNGNARWDVTETIITEVMEDYGINVTVYRGEQVNDEEVASQASLF